MSLRISSLTKKFGEKTILSKFSYDFSDKGIYAISGNSGIGKTTLLRIICGLDNDYEGEVISSGGFSVAFQEHRLFSTLTALENVLAAIEKPNKYDIIKAKALLGRLGFTKGEMLLTPDKLSGGMKQRVSLARAFMKESAIYLLDEATKELDERLKFIVLDIIKEYSKERLVILITHDPEDISYLGAEEIKL